MKYILERMPTTNRKVGGSNPFSCTNNGSVRTRRTDKYKNQSEMVDFFLFLETLGQLIYNKKEIRIKKANSCQNYYRKECE